jgi:transposase
MADQGYCKFRAKRRPKISASTARLRLQLAADWQGFDFGRNRFRFGDECSLARGSGHHTTWVWRLPAEKWSHEMVEEVTTARQSARMIWASISMTPGGRVWRSELVVMTRDEAAARRRCIAQSYIQALEEELRDSYRPGEWFMQDNAPIHTAHTSREWLEVHCVHTVNWPPYSPDLNPIEHLLWALKKKLHELHPEFDHMETLKLSGTHLSWGCMRHGLLYQTRSSQNSSGLCLDD